MNYADFFKNIKTIAVVGLSDNPQRPSFQVAKFLMEKGFRVIPVNPNIDSFLGRKSYASLSEVKEKIDVVEIFRRSEFVEKIVDEAIKINAKSIWMQEGVINNEAAKKAKDAGLNVVMNMCMMKVYKRI